MIVAKHGSISAFSRCVEGSVSDDGLKVTSKRIERQLGLRRSQPPDWALAEFIIAATTPPEVQPAIMTAAHRDWRLEQAAVDEKSHGNVVETEDLRARNADLATRLTRLVEQRDLALRAVFGLTLILGLAVEHRREAERRAGAAGIVTAELQAELRESRDSEVKLQATLDAACLELARRDYELGLVLAEQRERQEQTDRTYEKVARTEARRQLGVRRRSTLRQLDGQRQASMLAGRISPVYAAHWGFEEPSIHGPEGLRPARSQSMRYLAVYLDTCAGLNGLELGRVADLAGTSAGRLGRLLIADTEGYFCEPLDPRTLEGLARVCGADPEHAVEMHNRARKESDGELARPLDRDLFADIVGSILDTVRDRTVDLALPVGLALLCVVVAAPVFGLLYFLGNASPSAPPNTLIAGTRPVADLNDPPCGSPPYGPPCTPDPLKEVADLTWSVTDRVRQSADFGRVPTWWDSPLMTFYQIEGQFALTNTEACPSGAVNWAISVPGGPTMASGRLTSSAPSFEEIASIPLPTEGTNAVRVSFERIDSGFCTPEFRWASPSMNFSGRDVWIDFTVFEQ